MPLKHPLPTLLLVAALATLGAPRAGHAGEMPSGFVSPEAEVQYNAMAGELAAQRRQPLVAAQHFLRVLAVQPEAELAMRTTALALVGKDEKLALVAARIWSNAAPKEAEPRHALMRLALRNGAPDEARAQAQELIESHPEGKNEGFRQVAQLLAQEPEHKAAAMALMGQLRAQWLYLPGAPYAQAVLALRYGDLDLAEKFARESLALKADSTDAILLLTAVLVKRGDLAGADRTFAPVIKLSNDPAGMHAAYARLLLDAEKVTEARQQYLKALDRKPEFTEARYALGLLALEQEDLAAAEAQFRVLLNTESLKSAAAYYLGRIEETRKNYAEALTWYAQVADGDSALNAVTRRAAVMSRMGQLQGGRELLAQMREQNPELANRFYLAEGELLLEAGAGAEALAMYQAALKEAPDDPELLYGRSLVHERMNSFKQAEADLRAILKANPEDARAMNALGYMLTVRNQRLPEARKLIARALELTPDDAAVIDSMGWVEFRQGKLKEALALLEKAFDKAKDPEIAAHLGEVLWKLGNKQRAREIWEAALTRDPEHRVLKETFERLTR